MRVGMYSGKGGVGKTSLSFSFAKDMGLAYITNDLSIVIQKYSKAKYYSKNIPLKLEVLQLALIYANKLKYNYKLMKNSIIVLFL